MLGELADQLGDGQLVTAADVVQHAQGVVLHTVTHGVNDIYLTLPPEMSHMDAFCDFDNFAAYCIALISH